MKRRVERPSGPVLAVLGLLGGALVGLGPSGCEEPGAPTETEVCWRAEHAPRPPQGPLRFSVLGRGVATLDDCAAELEAIHLEGQAEVRGAFQGYFIFIDARQVASSTRSDGFGYPIFQPGQRRQIDADLRALIKARAGALPSAGDISVERK